MPEGHLLHRYAREQTLGLAGEKLAVTSPQGRFDDARALDGLRLEGVQAYGKHLFYAFERDTIVHVHLGQRGVFLHFASPAPSPAPQVRLRLASPRATFDLIAPSLCERIDSRTAARIIDGLGPDPLRPDADPERALAAIASRATPIGALLLDQSVVAGAGNVLRSEVLFLCGIDPRRPGRDLSRAEREAVWQALVDVMRRAADDGRILTAVPPGADRRAIPEREARYVYRQDRCRRCGSPIETPTIGGRTMYVCPRCQRVARNPDERIARPE